MVTIQTSSGDAMRNGDDLLAAVAADAKELHELDARRGIVRARLLDNLVQAHNHKKTQQVLADASAFSRQRIGQFLKEARKNAHAR